MMLQTLVENAIKHGISQDKKGGLIKIISGLEGSYHFLTVQNTGHLNGGRNAEGFGLASTLERLQLLYGEKAKFEIFQLDNSLVQATIKIPLNFN
jgi:LytS/YehU family sensor histidine kinase